jgi:glycosyltransferase involved in cell wall biosynthesis
VSEEARESLPARERERCETLVHGIEVDAVARTRTERGAARAELGIPDDVVAIGTVANYHPKKDWPNLLRAARIVGDLDLPVRFVFVGQGPLQEEVEKLHAELGLGELVHLTGHRPDAIRCMAACDLFVLGSRWEGLPVALMEAFALGLPVVVTAVGGIPQHVSDGVEGLLVPPGDPEALAAAIEKLVRDPDERSLMSRASSARAETFDIRRAQARVEEIYEEVVAR